MDSDPSTRPRFIPCSGESWRSPWAMYAGLRDGDPVHHAEELDYWVLSRFADVFAAVRDTRTFSSAEGLTFTYDERNKAGLAEAAPMVMMDPPEHTAFRRLVGQGFTPRHVQEIEPAVRTFVVERLERLRAAGGGDVVADLFKPMPSFVVAYYLGVPETDWGRFDAWTQGIVAANAAGDPLQAGASVGELFEYFSDLISQKRAHPGEDTISALVATGARDVPIMQVLGFAFTMVTGGNDTTTGMLSTGAELLTRRPDQRARLLADPSLLDTTVEEMLRLAAPVQGLARTTTSAVTLHDVTIPVGKKVLLLYGSANRDPRQFGPTAEDFDVDRRIGPMLSFGYGAHHCLGAAAARLQARIALEELLVRCPRFAVDYAAGSFAAGHFVRRYETLPFIADAL
ncbi:MAG: cytochrome P450 [Acidimicrobiia bacterium]|nr:cytochrome P450 [Acidimicrobiia bacterium]